MDKLKELYRKGKITFKEFLERKEGMKRGFMNVGGRWVPSPPREKTHEAKFKVYKSVREGEAIDLKHHFGEDETHFGWSDEEVEGYYNDRKLPQ